ncbi:CPCC family cysteine-rich protein [Caulobacter mirabilis]|uniref:Cysteine-rich CPCC domain-containing protein n=1 Tax=Caulobacter mirabilis TaxID=69666 RepID=A0A2D2B041_9CAUL|nr:CPCC family cysteine-rich protein [Caulobacter mirabilis]ATQ43620.1 hypothetical protein CSW64_15050 [Caulobacter mirabilis]
MALDYTCPCCGYLTFDDFPGSYAVCAVCGWEDDGVQLRYPYLDGGANAVSLIEAQANFEAIGVHDPACLLYMQTLDKAELARFSRDERWRRVDPTRDRWERLEDVLHAENDNLAECLRLEEFHYWLR